MSISIHFLNGNDLSTQDHYLQKGYRDDIIIEINGLFYEVYFFADGSTKYEMTKDGFFSFPGMIVLDEIIHDKILLSVNRLLDYGYFEMFKGHTEFPLNKRFMQKWYLNEIVFGYEHMVSLKLR
jgi:hypothetical protein